MIILLGSLDFFEGMRNQVLRLVILQSASRLFYWLVRFGMLFMTIVMTKLSLCLDRSMVVLLGVIVTLIKRCYRSFWVWIEWLGLKRPSCNLLGTLLGVRHAFGLWAIQLGVQVVIHMAFTTALRWSIIMRLRCIYVVLQTVALV